MYPYQATYATQKSSKNHSQEARKPMAPSWPMLLLKKQTKPIQTVATCCSKQISADALQTTFPSPELQRWNIIQHAFMIFFFLKRSYF